jgi:putative transposase
LVLKTPVRALKANAICARFIGSVRCECLDRMIIVSERHLPRVIGAYVPHFNRLRPHQGIGQRIPNPPEVAIDGDAKNLQQIARYPVFGGLHHDFEG